jgi:hypothetical protein
MKQKCFCGRGGTAGLTASCVQAMGVLAPMSGACANLVHFVSSTVMQTSRGNLCTGLYLKDNTPAQASGLDRTVSIVT